MCTTCGCSDNENSTRFTLINNENKNVSFENIKPALHKHSHAKTIEIETDILSYNNNLAEKNRALFKQNSSLVYNVMSSPGSGKTSVLERTIKDLIGQYSIYVIEGDQQTGNDAKRIAKAGAKAIQINTGSGCHLDAEMIFTAYNSLKVEWNSIVFVENVGNLVCPALFDLGENQSIVVISVTEGEDKPLKYPNMFVKADICLINKIDLIPYLDFDIEKLKQFALEVNPNLIIFEISARSGAGMDNWYLWLKQQLSK